MCLLVLAVAIFRWSLWCPLLTKAVQKTICFVSYRVVKHSYCGRGFLVDRRCQTPSGIVFHHGIQKGKLFVLF